MLTLRQLKELVEAPKKGEKKPTNKSLMEGRCPVIAQKVIQSSSGRVAVTVYQNGYVVYQALNWATVFSIEEISGYHYDSVAGSGYGCKLDESYFEEADWYLRFVLYGEDRLNLNMDSRNKKHCISYTSVMEEMQFGEEIAQDKDIEEMIVQQILMESLLDTLTENQKELIQALYFECQTYQEYATTHGITSSAVNNMRRKAMNRLSASLKGDLESTKGKQVIKKCNKGVGKGLL